MKVRVNPLVLAAALGLLGPAALDEESPGPVGLWRRDGDDRPAPSGLGERIEVLAIEDRFFIDQGLGTGLEDSGRWTRLDDGALIQELQVDGARVRREFRAEEDSLSVRTQIEAEGSRSEREDRFKRLG